MATEWKLSSYTSMTPCDSGDLLLHNSFMGAVARVPAYQVAHITKLMQSGVRESQMGDPAIRELCDQGFLVPSDCDERNVVEKTLNKERSAYLSLMILSHENCNFRCVYCYEKFERGKMREDIVKGLKIYVDQNVGNFNGLSVEWFGGEPLLGCDVICDLSESFIASCKRHGVDCGGGMSTNGYLLTPQIVDQLFEHRITNFQICLDGPETIHNRKRKLAGGGGTYRRIIDNLTCMRNRKDDFFVSIRTNFDNESVPYIDAWLVEELAPRFANDPRFGLYFEPVTKRGGPNDSALDVCDFRHSFSLSSRFFEKAITLGFSDRPLKRFLTPDGVVCRAGSESAYVVGSQGVVYKCSLVFDDPRNAVGTLTGDGQLHLDPAKASMWTSLEGRDTSACDSCVIYPVCQSRKCPWVTINENRPTCPMTHEMYATLVRLIAFGRGSDPQ